MEEYSGSQKAFYLIFLFIIAGFLGFGYIGATTSVKAVIVFYILFMFLPSFGITILDYFTKKRELEEIDTVTYDDPEDSTLNDITGFSLSFRGQLILGVLMAGFFAYQITSTGLGIIAAPSFGVFESQVGNALLSGAVGIVEDFAFFGVVFPLLKTNLNKHLGNILLATIMAIIVTAFIFMGYHSWRYKNSEIALISTLIFAIISTSMVSATNSLVVSNMMHFTNNFLITSGLARGAVAIVFAI